MFIFDMIHGVVQSHDDCCINRPRALSLYKVCKAKLRVENTQFNLGESIFTLHQKYI